MNYFLPVTDCEVAITIDLGCEIVKLRGGEPKMGLENYLEEEFTCKICIHGSWGGLKSEYHLPAGIWLIVKFETPGELALFKLLISELL